MSGSECTPSSDEPSRWAALALSPRAAVLLAAVVVGVAVVVVLVGALSGTGGNVVSVTGAPTAGADPSPRASRSGGSPSGGSPSVGSPVESSADVVVVHVVGAVERPGLVSLGGGSRVSAAIEGAGGATVAADLARLNLARVLVDGERLWVPEAGETEAPTVVDGSGSGGDVAGDGGSAPAEPSGGGDAVVDLNTADRAAFETLPGIGPALADRIIAWRDEHGRFTAVEDLLDVSGIGDGRFADLRDRVRV